MKTLGSTLAIQNFIKSSVKLYKWILSIVCTWLPKHNYSAFDCRFLVNF